MAVRAHEVRGVPLQAGLSGDLSQHVAEENVLPAENVAFSDAAFLQGCEVPSGDDEGMTAEETMRQVVAEAARLARPGDTVLMAPAAASMDVFTDYAHRGRAFAAAVGELG